MKERPILFSGPMVQAILEGRKTQTRRVVKPQPIRYESLLMWAKNTRQSFGIKGVDVPDEVLTLCPFGAIGNRLWVRENFYVQPHLWEQNHDVQPIHYASDVTPDQVEDYVQKPSIHMPKWASRITLEITGVRVERVRQITGEDCEKEGILYDPDEPEIGPCGADADLNLIEDFRVLWDSVYKNWNDNPWVWVVEFKRI